MGAKAIIARYVERNRSTLPRETEQLRQHLADVASGAKLRLTKKELDELVPPPAEKKPKRAQISEATEKSRTTASEEI